MSSVSVSTNKIKVNSKEYEVLSLLGHGKGGYSYLVKRNGKEYVCKKIHHEPCDYYTFGNKLESELKDYQLLKKTGILIPQLLEVDIQKERILKEYIPGHTIYHCVKNDKMKEIYYQQIQKIAHQVYQHNLNIDFFPTNFIVYQDCLYYIDYECNPYMEQWNYENWGIQYWYKTQLFLEYEKEHAK